MLFSVAAPRIHVVIVRLLLLCKCHPKDWWWYINVSWNVSGGDDMVTLVWAGSVRSSLWRIVMRWGLDGKTEMLTLKTNAKMRLFWKVSHKENEPSLCVHTVDQKADAARVYEWMDLNAAAKGFSFHTHCRTYLENTANCASARRRDARRKGTTFKANDDDVNQLMVSSFFSVLTAKCFLAFCVGFSYIKLQQFDDTC